MTPPMPTESQLRTDLAAAFRWAARLNWHEPYAYLKDVLERLPTQPASALHDLLPYRWKPAA